MTCGWMDGGLPPGFQKATLFKLPKLAFIPTFMMIFGEILLILTSCCQSQPNPAMFSPGGWGAGGS